MALSSGAIRKGILELGEGTDYPQDGDLVSSTTAAQLNCSDTLGLCSWVGASHLSQASKVCYDPTRCLVVSSNGCLAPNIFERKCCLTVVLYLIPHGADFLAGPLPSIDQEGGWRDSGEQPTGRRGIWRTQGLRSWQGQEGSKGVGVGVGR
jgi:hypothetical protein